MKKTEVVVTGVGVVSSLGIGKEAFWDAIISGRSGISKVRSFNTREFRCHYGGEIKNFRPEKFLESKKIKLLGRVSQYAIIASRLALGDAGLGLDKKNAEKTAVIFGTTSGEMFQEYLLEKWFKKNKKAITKSSLLQVPVNNISKNVANSLDITGPNYVIPTACAAGNYAIAYGADLIKNGDVDFVLAGGADYFSKVTFSGFHRLYAMAPKKCCPFDKKRKGMLVGEGAGVLLLESLQSALNRKANIYAKVLGYGLSCDAYHTMIPDKKGIEKAIVKAIKNSGIMPKDIDYICAHGTGTLANDKNECAAIKSIFGEKSKNIPVSSIKSMLGHTMSAASSLEAIACCMAIKNSVIPPTINFRTPDPECDIDCVPNKARKKKIRIALNNSFAFGGNNCCVIFGKV